MGDFGENLRKEREARGVTLGEISAATKISVRLLEAIENEWFERLPGGVFNTNFVRQYARHLGLDEEEVVGQYRALSGAGPAEEAAARAAPVSSEWQSAIDYEWDQKPRPAPWLPAVFAVAVLLLGLLLWLGWKKWITRPGPAPPPVETAAGQRAPQPAMETPPAANPEPAPKTITTPPPPPAVAGDAPVRVEFRATEMVWVLVIADGEQLFETTLHPQQSRVVTARTAIRLRVGNAGGLMVKLNGVEQPPLGARDQRMWIELTPQGMRIESSDPPVSPVTKGNEDP